jgi:heptose I phosphotransferase
MTPLAVTLLLLLAGAAALVARPRAPQGRRRGSVAVCPLYRRLLRRNGLSRPDDFLRLGGLIVSGHADRNVTRLSLEGEEGPVGFFLKREHRVGRGARLANAWAGYGFVSRCVREARALEALRREGVGCPEWVAAGEDGAGRAFLLVRAVDGAADLPSFLLAERDRATRRRLIHRLGAAVARLHRAGFTQPDLYAEHVLVGPGARAVTFLDWQRSRRGPVPWRRRARDLAALDATLPEGGAARRERLAFLRAYLRADPGPDVPTAAATELARRVAARVRQLSRRRHIREKRRPLGAEAGQDWTCLDGEALCVTSALPRACPGGGAGWLALDRQPAPPAGRLARRWLALPGAARALLVRRRASRPLAALWCWLRGRPLASPEQRQAALLFRLQRHAVPAPRVLALGQRRAALGAQESFLLTEPVADAQRLGAWLRRAGGAAGPEKAARRRQVLREAGALLQRLHEAGCRLNGGCPLAVRAGAGGEPELVLAGVEGVTAVRGAGASWARRDVEAVRRALAASGCTEDDIRGFLGGYAGGAARPAPGGPAVNYRFPAPPPAGGEGGRGGLWARLVRGVRRIRRRPGWDRLAGPGWERRVMDVAGTALLHAKQGRSVARWELPDPRGPGRPLTVYLKRHHRLAWWKGALAAAWPGRGRSPALREWDHLEWARRHGIAVPRAVAAGEFVGPWGRLRGFLAVEELAGMLPLDRAVPLAARRLDPAAFRAWKRGLAAEVARVARLLHDRRRFHKDLYLCHLYVARADAAAAPRGPAGWRGRVFVIDLHRLAHHPRTWRLWQLKDLAQLLYSSDVPGLDVRDRLAFWHAYRDAGLGRRPERRLWRWVLFKWRRYRRHNDRGRARRERP